MAKAPAKPEAANPGAPPPPKKSGKLLLIIVIAALILTLIAAGVVILLLLKHNKANGNDGSAEQTPAAATEQAPIIVQNTGVDLSKPPSFVTLEPFTVNLHGENDHYLQTVIVLRTNDPKTAESLKGFMPEIRHRINLLLSSKQPSDLDSTEDREALATQILMQSNEALGIPPLPEQQNRIPVNAPIQAVRFNSFIIQ